MQGDLRSKTYVALRTLDRRRPSIARLQHVRPDSAPFLSGDTFRSMCRKVIDGSRVIERATGFPSFTFVEMEKWRLSGWNEQVVLEHCAGKNVVIHNGDITPPDFLIRKISGIASSVWCVNYLGRHPGVSALPIGLENLWWNTNGRIEDFLPRPTNTRVPRIFANFRPHTNPGVRLPLELACVGSAVADQVGFKRPSRLHELMRRYCLVLSPPGNGADCHRTWEAVYLGAVPIVLSSHFPKAFSELPVLTVDSFEEVLSLDENRVREIYSKYSCRDKNIAYHDYWLQRFSRISNGEI
jgi:hypothetical protein